MAESPRSGASSPGRRTRAERAKLILRAIGTLLLLPGLLVFLGAGAGEWSSVGRLFGFGLLLAAVPAFVAAECATSWSRRVQVLGLLISVGYLLLFGYLFLNGLAYALQRPIGTAGFWLLNLAGIVTVAPATTTALLAKVVAWGDH